MSQRGTRTRSRLATVAISATAMATALSVAPAHAGTTAHAANGTIQLAGSEHAIPGSYIVKLADDELAERAPGGLLDTLARRVQAVLSTATSLTDRYGGGITRTFSSALHGYATRMSETQALKLAADPAVEYVQPNQRLHAVDTQQDPPSWGLDRIDQRDLPLDNSYTSRPSDGVDAYIIDTGVRIGHNDFEGRARYGYDAVDGDNEAPDGHGHGTHVAGTVAGAEHGVAKDANIVAVRVLGDDGSGTTAQVIDGIDWVTEHHSGPSVANMSLGGNADPALDDAVRNSIDSGVTYSVAAGNGIPSGGLPTPAQLSSPARVTEAITVAASDDQDGKALWSNFGSVVDLFAPGVDITSAWNTSDEATNTISGTSMAAPHVAGAAAQYLAAHPGAEPPEVQGALVDSATEGRVSMDPVAKLAGTPNRLLYAGE